MKNCIFLTFDDSYFDLAKVCIGSLKINYPNHPLVLVDYRGSDSEIIDFIINSEKFELLNIDLDIEKFKSLNLGVVGSSIIYHRFLLWEDYFLKYDTIIYLDCDMVILQPFPELFESRKFLAIHDNSSSPIFNKKHPTQELSAIAKTDGINIEGFEDNMINSGLLVIPKEFRSRKYLEQLWHLTSKYDKYTYHSDQSILSIWMYINKMQSSLDYKYNFQSHFIMMPKIQNTEIESIKILHYSHYKPNSKLSFLKKRVELAESIVNLALEQFEKFSSQ